MATKQRKIADLIPKKLALLEREWSSSTSGKTTHTFIARLWQPKVKRYTFATLKSSNEHRAREEAFQVWSKLSVDVEAGRDVGARRRKLDSFVDDFLAAQKQRADDKQISVKRLEVLGHHLVSLKRFYETEKRPPLDELARRYTAKWNSFRSKDRASKTGKTLSTRFRNNEITTHKMFFRWCVDQQLSSVIPSVPLLKVERTNAPFPNEFYRPLLTVSRKEIQSPQTKPHHRWQLMNYRTVILLMSGIGCRVLETKNLKWNDITERRDGTFIYLHGKGKERTIRLPERVFGHLQDLRCFKEANWEGYNAEEFPYVFNAFGSPKPSNQYDINIRKRWMKAAGMKDYADYEYVCFRHKFITDALCNGAHSLSVAKYVGTSQMMIEKTYEGLVPSDVYDLVFKTAPDDALARKATPKWLEELTN